MKNTGFTLGEVKKNSSPMGRLGGGSILPYKNFSLLTFHFSQQTFRPSCYSELVSKARFEMLNRGGQSDVQHDGFGEQSSRNKLFLHTSMPLFI